MPAVPEAAPTDDPATAAPDAPATARRAATADSMGGKRRCKGWSKGGPRRLNTLMASWLPWLGFAATLLLVVVGLLNYSIFRRQLHLAKVQMDLALRHLELSQKQPDLMLIQRAVSETSDHTRVLVERAWLRPYFYEDRAWREGDRTSRDEVYAMAELMLNNFASALMHSAAFPEYPVRGIDRIIAFHLRHSPALRTVLEGDIRLRDLAFGYSAEKNVLHDVNLAAAFATRAKVAVQVESGLHAHAEHDHSVTQFKPPLIVTESDVDEIAS